MSTTKGQRRGILATLMSVLALLLVGVLLTAGASRAAAQTTAGTATAGTAGTAAAAGNTRQVLYMFPEEGYVELLVLEITGSRRWHRAIPGDQHRSTGRRGGPGRAAGVFDLRLYLQRPAGHVLAVAAGFEGLASRRPARPDC